jgi:hypothetical protein
MPNHTRRRWGIGLVVGLAACGVMGGAPVHAQSAPIIVPPIAPIVIGFPGDSGVNSRGGLIWATSGRADVDVDIDRQHGQAAAS